MANKPIYAFGSFRLEADRHLLTRDGIPVSLPLKACQVLTALVEERGDVIDKRKLMELVWPDSFVEEANLSHHIYALRKALGDDKNSNRFIETVPKRGYRFAMEVREAQEVGAEAEVLLVQADRQTAGSSGGENESAGTDGASSYSLRPLDQAKAQDSVSAFKSELDTWWEERQSEIHNGQSPGDKTVGSRSQLLKVGGIGTLLVVAIALATWFFWPRSTPRLPLRRFSFAPKEPVMMSRISPDGKHIAYTTEGNESDLWIQDLDRIEPRKIPGTQGAEFPFWSPDSSAVAFGTKSELRSVPVILGDPVTICQLPIREPFTGGTWSRTGHSIIFTQATRQFFEVPSRGGTPKVLVEIPASDGMEHVEHPCQIPGPRNQLLFMFKKVGEPHSIGLISIDSGRYENLLPPGLSGICPVYSETGHILFDARSEDWNYAFTGALPFSVASGKVTGDLFPIATNANFPSTSRDGMLIYVENAALWPPRQLVWRNRNGAKVEILGPIPYGTMEFALSPDQHKLAMSRLAKPHFVVRDLASGAEISPVSNLWQFGLLWTPDGSALTFAGVRGGNYDLLIQPAKADAHETALADTDANEFPGDWSADGKFLIYSVESPTSPWDIWYLKRKEDGKGYESAPFLQTPYKERCPRLSPDGRLAAFSSDELGRSEIFVANFPASTGKLRVSTNGGECPFWSRDGKELYYLEGQTLMAVATDSGPKREFGSPVRLFDDPLLNTLGISPPVVVSLDRQRFLMKETTGDALPPVIRVVQNWYSEFTGTE